MSRASHGPLLPLVPSYFLVLSLQLRLSPFILPFLPISSRYCYSFLFIFSPSLSLFLSLSAFSSSSYIGLQRSSDSRVLLDRCLLALSYHCSIFIYPLWRLSFFPIDSARKKERCIKLISSWFTVAPEFQSGRNSALPSVRLILRSLLPSLTIRVSFTKKYSNTIISYLLTLLVEYNYNCISVYV